MTEEYLGTSVALVGPLGFVLDKAQWLDRYSSGDLGQAAYRVADYLPLITRVDACEANRTR